MFQQDHTHESIEQRLQRQTEQLKKLEQDAVQLERDCAKLLEEYELSWEQLQSYSASVQTPQERKLLEEYGQKLQEELARNAPSDPKKVAEHRRSLKIQPQWIPVR